MNDNEIINHVVNGIRLSTTSYIPFEHVVIDNFLPQIFIEKLFFDLQDLEESEPDKVFESANGHKKEYKNRRSNLLNYDSFLNVLECEHVLKSISEKFNLAKLLADTTYDGGGYVISPENTFLRYHADFNYSGITKMYRTINLIIYFNKNYKPEFGGKLHLLDNVSKTVESQIEPLFNRAIMFKTNKNTPHGVTINRNFKRRSFNCYYYSNHPNDDDPNPHKTLWI